MTRRAARTKVCWLQSELVSRLAPVRWQTSSHQSPTPAHPAYSAIGRAGNISQSADGRDRVGTNNRRKVRKQKVIKLQETGLEGMSGGWIDYTCVIPDRCDLKKRISLKRVTATEPQIQFVRNKSLSTSATS